MKPAIFSIAAYAAKMMTMPVGTRFELHGQEVGRITYTVRTCKLLMNAVYPGRRTLRRRWHGLSPAHLRAASHLPPWPG